MIICDMSHRLNKVTFIVEAPEDHSSDAFALSANRLIDGVKEAGCQLALASRNRQNVDLLPGYSVDPKNPTVAWGSIQFMQHLKIPHIAYGWDQTDMLYLSANYGRSKMFNSRYMISTIGDILRDWNYLYVRLVEQLNEGSRGPGLFIRPVSGRKEFAGQVFKSPRDFEILTLEQLGLPIETLCFFDAVKNLEIEIRCWLVDSKVELATVYNGIELTDAFPSNVFEHIVEDATYFCNNIARNDSCFVMDLAVSSRGVTSIMELNSFCCSGFYDANTTNLVEAVARQAVKDYN